MKKVFSILVILVLMFSVVGCSDDDDGPTSPVESLQVNGGDHSADVTVGEDYSLPTEGTAIRENGNKEDVEISWGSEVDTSSTGEYEYSGTTSDIEDTPTIKFTVTVNPEDGTEVDVDDPSAPEAPTGIETAKVDGEDGVTLSWDDTADEYIVYRGDKYNPLMDTAITDNEYTDYTATPGEEYTYYVQAIDEFGEEDLSSDLSEEVTQEAGGYEGIKVHYKHTGDETPGVHAWEPDGGDELTDWPGDEMTEEDDDWYVAEFSDYTELNMQFTDIDDETGFTSDLERTKGEWWYKDGEWHYTNPEK